jgi:hypothetical protein
MKWHWNGVAWEEASASQQVEPKDGPSATYPILAKRRFLQICGNPRSHTGTKFYLVAKIDQKDSSMGRRWARVSVFHDIEPEDSWYIGGVNAFLVTRDNSLEELVCGDIIAARATVGTPTSYDTTLGATLTVPKFNITRLKLIRPVA